MCNKRIDARDLRPFVLIGIVPAIFAVAALAEQLAPYSRCILRR